MGQGVWIILLRQGFFKQKLKPVGSLFQAMIYLGRHSRGFCFGQGCQAGQGLSCRQPAGYRM